MQLTTYTKTGNISKNPTQVSDAIFAGQINQQLLAQAIRVYLSNQRQGTSKTQTRSDVTRTSKKWYKQKGTGNARHGARTANLFVGGSVAHGPTGLENWSRTMSTRQKHHALATALSAQQQNIVVADAINDLSGKTKEAAKLIELIAPSDKRVLIIVDEFTEPVIRSLRNLEHVMITKAIRANVYEVALAQKIILTTEAIKVLEERLAKSIK